MGYQSISQLGSTPFFQTAFAQGKVSENSFSFRLGSSGSELYLGGANKAKYTGSLETHPGSLYVFEIMV